MPVPPRLRFGRRRLLLAAACVLLAACGPADGDPAWRASIEEHRDRLDAFFATDRSPLDPGDRSGFRGLKYFSPDPAWVLRAPLDRSGAGEAVSMLDTQGNVRKYRVHGRLHLEKDGTPFTLTVYRGEDGGSLFLPFRDATTGSATYGVGRYLDLEPAAGDSVTVDFNRAYNPYCAYAERWACPLVPAENHVPLAVKAGEKKFR